MFAYNIFDNKMLTIIVTLLLLVIMYIGVDKIIKYKEESMKELVIK